MKVLLLFALCVSSLGANRLDLSGRITTSDGVPISGATAYVSTAGAKSGSARSAHRVTPTAGRLPIPTAPVSSISGRSIPN
jgi:hypothetical protein